MKCLIILPKEFISLGSNWVLDGMKSLTERQMTSYVMCYVMLCYVILFWRHVKIRDVIYHSNNNFLTSKTQLLPTILNDRKNLDLVHTVLLC